MTLKNIIKLSIVALSLSNQSYAGNFLSRGINKYGLFSGYPTIEVGGMVSDQGHSQSIRISGLMGDRYTVKDGVDSNAIFGISYFLDYQNKISIYKSPLDLSYGISAYYLFPTKVQGKISQEHMFENFKYEYKTRNFPVYLAAKITSKPLLLKNNFATTFNLGIGPSFTKFSRYNEKPNGSMNIPNQLFTSNNDVVFSFIAGLGLKSNNLLKNGVANIPVECGYKFFFFSESHLKKNNLAVLDTLKSGNSIVHALTCGMQFDNLTFFN